MPSKLDEAQKEELANIVSQLQQKETRNNSRHLAITPTSLIPISVVIGLLGGVWGIAIAFSSFTTQIADLRREVADLKKRVWYLSEQKLWAKEFQLKNTKVPLDVPPPADFAEPR